MGARLAGKTVVITGAAQGMGRATAAACSAEGASVVLVDRDAAVADVAAGLGGKALVGDVTDPAVAAAGVALAVDSYGALHGLANVAGAHRNGEIATVSDEEWAAQLAINLTAPMLWSRAAVPAMLDAGGGSIVVVASMNASRAHPRSVAYNTSKSGVLGLVRSIAVDCGRQGVRANIVSPGAIETEMLLDAASRHPLGAAALDTHRERALLGRLGQPSEIASACLFLLSDEASYVTGHDLVVDGGRTVTT